MKTIYKILIALGVIGITFAILYSILSTKLMVDGLLAIFDINTYV